jgi:surface polysaccharide O-acyltransferase-like enzyme
MKNHVVAFDYLRFLAVIAVVFIHSYADTLFIYQPVVEINWWVGTVIASITHWAVPVFFMMSGALHLGKVIENPRIFFLNKINRVLIPLLIFVAIYALFYHLVKGDELTVGFILHRLVFDQPYEHLYFLIALFFLFLITPLLNYLLSLSSKLKTALFTISILYTLFIPQTRFIGVFWIPFVSYYLAGYVLYRWHLNTPRFSKPSLLLCLIIMCMVSMMLGTALLTTHFIPNHDGFYLFGISSPLTILLSYSLFMLFLRIFFEKKKDLHINRLAECAFGVYLIHPLFIKLSFTNSEPTMLWRFITVVFTLFVSWVLTDLFRNSLGKRLRYEFEAKLR